jgi:hypothetical protein
MGSTGGLELRSHRNIHIDPGEAMSTARRTSNKATIRRFCDATNTGDAELISKTIDELVEPDVLIHMPLPIQATGA